MNPSAVVAGLQLHRLGVALALASSLLVAVPDLAVVGALGLVLCALGSGLGLVIVAVNAPSGSGVGGRLGLGVLLAAVAAWLQTTAVERGFWALHVNVAQQVTGALVGVVAGAAIMSLWLALAGAVNALQAGERFRVPLLLFVVEGLARCGLMAVEAPLALQLAVLLALGVPGLWLYWSALSGLRAALEHGTDEVTA